MAGDDAPAIHGSTEKKESKDSSIQLVLTKGFSDQVQLLHTHGSVAVGQAQVVIDRFERLFGCRLVAAEFERQILSDFGQLAFGLAEALSQIVQVRVGTKSVTPFLVTSEVGALVLASGELFPNSSMAQAER